MSFGKNKRNGVHKRERHYENDDKRIKYCMRLADENL